jgi:hypothetical protein
MFSLKINTDNSAFEHPEQEIARLLRQIADRLEHSTRTGVIRDINGNRVGDYAYIAPEED